MEEKNIKKEKKEIKINLWTFYVLVASVIILLAATVLGWMQVAKQNQNEPQNKLPENSITTSANEIE